MTSNHSIKKSINLKISNQDSFEKHSYYYSQLLWLQSNFIPSTPAHYLIDLAKLISFIATSSHALYFIQSNGNHSLLGFLSTHSFIQWHIYMCHWMNEWVEIVSGRFTGTSLCKLPNLLTFSNSRNQWMNILSLTNGFIELIEGNEWKFEKATWF
jgi:hypothetical protein